MSETFPVTGGTAASGLGGPLQLEAFWALRMSCANPPLNSVAWAAKLLHPNCSVEGFPLWMNWTGTETGSCQQINTCPFFQTDKFCITLCNALPVCRKHFTSFPLDGLQRMEEQPECRDVKKLHRVLHPNPFTHGSGLMGSQPLAHGYSIYKFF